MFFALKRSIKSFRKKSSKNKFKYLGIKISIIYLTIGFIWVYFSDRFVNSFFYSKDTVLIVNTYKGWVYVFISTAVLYPFIRRFLKKVEETENELNDSYKELRAKNEELQAYVGQLTAAEEFLRIQYDKIIENEGKLIKSEEESRAIIKALPDLLFVVDRDGVFIDYQANDETLLLMKKNKFIGKNIYEVLPDDIAKIGHEKIKLVLETGELQSFEYQLHVSGKEQYFELRMVKRGQDEVLAIARNITAALESKIELKASEYTFRTLFENSADAILIIEDNKIIDCNLAAFELLGYDCKTNISNRYLWSIAPDDQPDGINSKEKAIKAIETSEVNIKSNFEWWFKKNDGTIFPVEIMLTSIVLNGKKVFHALCRDLNKRKQMEQKLEYLSYHDQLTGLYNRRFFEKQLENLNNKENLPLTIVMADVNGLKLINDSFGHSMGDELLIKVSEVIKKGCRNSDIVARLGGDEFIILLPKTSKYEGEQIVKNIKNLSLKEKVRSVDVSISFGLDTKEKIEEKIYDVLKTTEDNMYKKKLFESPSMRGKTIKAIINTLHEKNKREEQHSYRVSLLCKRMGEAIGLSEREIEELKTAGLLHDIGKIAIDENILNKSGKLTDDEWQVLKRHPEIGYRILSTVNDLSEIAEYVLAHHEMWNGKGYPKGLKGEEIPFQARIISIVDAYDAITSERSYRSALSEEFAVKELQLNAGIQFDPQLVKVFIEKVYSK
ncbi:PAS domain S-box-containing protein/diguanylate cyclase (GGDEF) domain-containing protein [Clostridium cavendishii DSM 21758]|uniref:PAS domain S-box-containing protein/diguanylate cyclase (GGDEF) domain-containing protein n=1 Tax=Clostridium cavendishii DSM 21758 TaxID=1121302 RepID=A0A1M6FBY6_9CLOT|nr:HD domain-containing phosphohydrolase [Clostridium cavendishii]SHI95182.1 PAS domain S-box-containing protein/diguanylate cyclase (GGDEF) domain-containing protein [Clostridium cavendishii DSM 21758]